MGSNSKFQKTLLNTQLHSQVCPPLHTQARPVLAHSSHSWPGMVTLVQRDAEVMLGSLCGIPNGKLTCVSQLVWCLCLKTSFASQFSGVFLISAGYQLTRWVLLWILTWLCLSWLPELLLSFSREAFPDCSRTQGRFLQTFSSPFSRRHARLLVALSQLAVAGWLIQSLLTVSWGDHWPASAPGTGYYLERAPLHPVTLLTPRTTGVTPSPTEAVGRGVMSWEVPTPHPGAGRPRCCAPCRLQGQEQGDGRRLSQAPFLPRVVPRPGCALRPASFLGQLSPPGTGVRGSQVCRGNHALLGDSTR